MNGNGDMDGVMVPKINGQLLITSKTTSYMKLLLMNYFIQLGNLIHIEFYTIKKVTNQSHLEMFIHTNESFVICNRS